ncbi:SRPBCC family protein [Sediminitomix flava]|uniref:Polyketide cyclase/dehydrase/lipid transport protein n=1 Tax=Sediminitomix flava TaxID=379075 RepID=A0A315YWE7_SEDFL|nr:hypothetical protein [Sediminitomix flava]PWJ34205.1 hypothetical protein BC781_111115 [Sediminitomix flava]
MKITKSIKIKASIEKVWQVWAVEFDKAGDWMSQVVHAVEKKEGQLALGSPMIGRVCTFSDKENAPYAEEDIKLFDKENYRLNIQVVPYNLPAPVVQNLLKSKLNKVSEEETEIVFEANIEIKTVGYFLYPILKGGLSKGLDEILEELKYYAEKGIVHPRKLKKLEKRSVKVA